MGTQKHTATPWMVNGKQSIRGSQGEYIARANWNNGEANSAFIVRACNSHQRLVEACVELLGVIDRIKAGTINLNAPATDKLIALAEATLKQATEE